MQETKTFTQSKSIIGSIIAIVAMSLGMIGYEVSPGDQQQMVQVISHMVTLLGSLIAIYGRVVATKEIKTK